MSDIPWTVDGNGCVHGIPYHDAVVSRLSASKADALLSLTYETEDGRRFELTASIAGVHFQGTVLGAVIFDILFVAMAERGVLAQHGYDSATLFPWYSSEQYEAMAAAGLHIGVIDCINDVAVVFIAKSFSVAASA
jgi:hypothetical protein